MALTDNLVSYWALDEASGSRADAHSSNDLSDNNTVSSTTGNPVDGGNYAVFAAASSEYLSIADGSQSGLDFSGTMTIAGWIRFASLPSGASMGFVTKGGFGSSQLGYALGYREDGASRDGMDFFVASDGSYGSTGQDAMQSPTTFIPTLNTWYHVAFVFNGSLSNANKGKHYVNGIEYSTDVSISAATLFNSNALFCIGGFDPPTSSTAGYLNGGASHIGVWSSALTSSDISELYNSGAGFAYPFTAVETKKNLTLLGVS